MEQYFAYGSNLGTARMRERVPAARLLGAARLTGYRLAFDKPGGDGSGKANVHPAAFDRNGDGHGDDPAVWGVVYALDAADWALLDRFEPGYERVRVCVESATGEWLRASTYIADRLTHDPVPLEWYKKLVVDGAREHALPAAWVAFLESTPSRC